MKLLTRGFSATYELESLARMLFPGTQRAADAEPPAEGDWILAEMRPQGETCALSIAISLGGAVKAAHAEAPMAWTEKERTFPLCRLLYETACEATGETLRWGLLTGIRPIKLFHRLLAQGLNDGQVIAQMRERWLLSEEMARLALSIARREAAINTKSVPEGFSLYLSVPFCPQRCSYCSFVSSTVERMRPLIGDYVTALCREIEATAAIADRLGLRLQTVYVGGGTPTTLAARQLSAVIETVRRSFDCSGLLEFTVEAGRPDTINRERLLALREGGVDRISINPQTMNDETLAAVGRGHTAQAIEEAFALARGIGFRVINADLIAGLAEETPEAFLASLGRLIALAPENITVHTLTLKRASSLVEAGEVDRFYRRRADVARMIDGARARLTASGWQPYYLYRQKNTIGALDNTGYAKPGCEGFYNVLIMDETQSILACGAGAVTKLRAPFGEQIERVFNYKYPAEYLQRFDEVLRRKEGIERFYEDHLSGSEFPH